MAKEREEREEEREERAEHSEAQAIEGYGCICGFKTGDGNEIRTHFMVMGKQDGKGIHKSLGRINLQTGESIMPPWNKRTKEQRQASTYGKHTRGTSTTGTSSGTIAPIRTTEVLADAQELRFVPRVYTTDYSPIIRAAQEAAVRFWGWRPDMPLGNFLDTCLHMFFEEKGITLAGYIVSEEAQAALKEREAQEAQIAQVEHKKEEVVEHGT